MLAFSLFNMGKYEVAIILIVACFVIGVPFVTWWIARRASRRRGVR